jgi:[NiFe] hydrogenase assembly HybE family chaperone
MTSHPAKKLETAFNQIYHTRMAGLPIVNPALDIEAVGFTPYDDGWLGILITPWFMSLLFLARGETAVAIDKSLQLGDTLNYDLPSGSYEFRVSQEDTLGRYLACPLFSPMGDFPNQDSARNTAQTLLTAILEQTNATLNAPENVPDTAKESAVIDTSAPNNPQPTSPARRALFRKFFAK